MSRHATLSILYVYLGILVGGGCGDETTNIFTVNTDASAQLADLKISGGTIMPSFLPEDENYFVTLPSWEQTFSVTPTTMDAAATIMVNGQSLSSGETSAPLTAQTGEQIVTIRVTSADGSTAKTYVLFVNWKALTHHYLKASNTDIGDSFGSVVSIDGDRLVVGAPF
jgi:uncharacterized lipoprotein YajG